MNPSHYVLLAILVAAGLYFWEKRNKKSSSEGATAPSKPIFPCVIEGTMGSPPMADKLKALQIEAASKGITMTGNYDVDVAAQGGEMILLGNGFKFTVDTAGKIVESESHANIFLVDYPVTGGIDGNGNLGMDINVGGAIVNVRGQIVNGKLVEGKAIKSWLPHIYGVLNGTWRSTL